MMHDMCNLLNSGVDWPEQALFRDTIEVKMDRQLLELTSINPLEAERLLDEWKLWFDLEYIDGQRDFFYLAVASIEYMSDRLALFGL